ncbi:MAG: hypothetical protein R3D00_05060 [Bacteroidia bacterium]
MRLPIIVLIVTFSIFSQVSAQYRTAKVRHTDFDLNGKVVKAEIQHFKKQQNPNPAGQGVLERSEEITFKNGYIETSAEYYPQYNIRHQYQYSFSPDYKAYTTFYSRLKNGEINARDTTRYKSYPFQGLDFFYPADAMVTPGESGSLALSYKLGKYKYNTVLSLEGRLIKVAGGEDKFFDLKGYLRKKEVTSNSETFNYNADGLYIGGEETSLTPGASQVKVFYDFDAHHNWVRKIIVDYTHGVITNFTYTARQLTYADKTVTGTLEYDWEFIRKNTAQ